MKFIQWAVIFAIITFSWIGLEYTVYGEIYPNNIDTFIAMLLAYLILDKTDRIINHIKWRARNEK